MTTENALWAGRTHRRCMVVAAGTFACIVASLSFEAFGAPGIGLPASGIDSLAGDPARLRLPKGSERLSLGAGMRVHGLPMRAEVFQTSASLRETSDLISGQPGATPSLLVLPGAVLLAWQSGSHHWMARLMQMDESLTRGTVSVLTLSDHDAPALAGDSVELDWLPTHARLLFTFDSADGTNSAQQMRQGIYVHDLPPSKLWPQIHARLRRTGWHRERGDPVHGEAERWSRGPHALTLLLVPVSGGSGMLTIESGPM